MKVDTWMVSVLTKSREKQFLGNGKNGHCDLEKSMKIKKRILLGQQHYASTVRRMDDEMASAVCGFNGVPSKMNHFSRTTNFHLLLLFIRKIENDKDFRFQISDYLPPSFCCQRKNKCVIEFFMMQGQWRLIKVYVQWTNVLIDSCKYWYRGGHAMPSL